MEKLPKVMSTQLAKETHEKHSASFVKKINNEICFTYQIVNNLKFC